MKTIKLSFIIFCLLLVSCGQKTKYNPELISSSIDVTNTERGFDVEYKETISGLKTIHVKFNDAVGFDALFDTGCSGLVISQWEFADLLKAGTISLDDYQGTSDAAIADGSTVTNDCYNIREVSIMDTKGQTHVVYNVTAVVMENPMADVLIGASIIDQLANSSFTVDLDKKIIRFQ